MLLVVKFLGLYCNLTPSPNKCQKSKQKLVSGFQINFLCIDLDQVNHLKDLSGGIQKIWEFHLPYYLYKPQSYQKPLSKAFLLRISGKHFHALSLPCKNCNRLPQLANTNKSRNNIYRLHLMRCKGTFRQTT